MVKTQNIKPIYWETSAFYIFTKSLMADHNKRIGGKFFMILTDKVESIDIDELEDYELACKII